MRNKIQTSSIFLLKIHTINELTVVRQPTQAASDICDLIIVLKHCNKTGSNKGMQWRPSIVGVGCKNLSKEYNRSWC